VATSASAASEFRVLGPVEAVRSGQPIRLGGRRQRWLLALLLVEPGRAISSDRLIDELWQGEPPRPSSGSAVRRAHRSVCGAIGPSDDVRNHGDEAEAEEAKQEQDKEPRPVFQLRRVEQSADP
jgi:hypothetical protein